MHLKATLVYLFIYVNALHFIAMFIMPYELLAEMHYKLITTVNRLFIIQ